MKDRIAVIEENEVTNSERLDSLKETVEENEVSNNERLDSIEETLEKNKLGIFFKGFNIIQLKVEQLLLAM